MGKHVIFMIHGMGQHPAGWSKDAVKTLKAQYKAFKLPGNFSDRFEIREIVYGEPFDEHWAEHENQVKALEAVTDLIPGGNALVKAVMKAASTVPEGFLRENIGDVVLYMSTLMNEPITIAVSNSIMTDLMQRGYPRYSILAHSMGTRVIHDVLQRSFTSVGSRGDDSYSLLQKPTVLMNIANVVKLASFDDGEFDVDDGFVVFPSDRPKKGVCWHYINADHPYDPFAAPRRYDPWFADDPLYERVNIHKSDVMSTNVHSLTDYLSHPGVAAAFLNRALAPDDLDPDPVSAPTIARALGKYRAGLDETRAEKVRELLERHGLQKKSASFEKWVERVIGWVVERAS